jgi:hypothetical protein
MDYDVQTVLGPKTAAVQKEDALVQLQTHPNYPQGAIVASFDEKNGQWVAKLRVPKEASTHEAAPPPPPGPPTDGPPTPPGASDGPPKSEDESSDGPPSDDAEKPSEDEGPPKPDDTEPEKPNLEHQVQQLTHLIQGIADALGVAGAGGPPHPGAGPEAEGPPPPPAGGPGAGHQGPGRPPSGPGGQSGMMRARPLKPGEAPNAPGVTPMGAPAFASVADDHPWKDTIGKTASFTATQEIDEDEPSEGLIARSASELRELAEPVGYKVGQVREGRTEDGKRCVKALITAH